MKKVISCILLYAGAVSFLVAKLHDTLLAEPSVGKWLKLIVYAAFIVILLLAVMKQFRDGEEPDEDRIDVAVPYTAGMKCVDALALVFALMTITLLFMQGWSAGLKAMALLSFGVGLWLKADDPQSGIIDARDQWELTAYSWHYRVEGLLIQLLMLFFAVMAHFFNDSTLFADVPANVGVPILTGILLIVLLGPLVVARIAIRRRRKRLNCKNAE